MAKRITLEENAKYVLRMGEFLELYKKERGYITDDTKSQIPNATYDDIDQLMKWWEREYRRSCPKGHAHTIHGVFESALVKVQTQMQGANRSALYPDNKWIFFKVLMQLALHLDMLNDHRPSTTELILESLQEAFDDRIDDVSDLMDRAGSAASSVASFAGDAVSAVGKAGDKLWSNVKIVTYVGLGVIGTAIVLPPVIRAVRSKPTE